MYSISIVKFIYKIVHQGIKIWSENDEIAVFVPDKIIFHDIDKEFLSKNVDAILHCLDLNKILTKEDQISILRIEEDKIELSFAQERMKFIDEYEEGTSAYNIPMVFQLANNIDNSVLEASLKDVVNRHSILRTIIKSDNKGIDTQQLLDYKKYPLNIIRHNCNYQGAFLEILNKELYYAFNLSEEYVVRVCLYHLNKKSENYMSIVVHHIAFDRWSIEILEKELEEFYRYNLALKKGEKTTLNLKCLNIEYKDFAVWQRTYLSGKIFKKKLSFWKNKLIGFENLNLITDKSRPNNIDYSGDQLNFRIDQDIVNSLRVLAKNLEISLFSVFLTGFYLLLRMFSNQDDFVVGTPMANRNFKDLEGIIGLFVNTVVLRAVINKEEKIKDLLKRIAQEIVEVQSYQDLQFEKLINELNIEKDTSRHPLFQVMFSFDSSLNQNINKDYNRVFQEYAPEHLKYKVAKFDLTAYVIDKGHDIEGIFNYATSLYNKETIRRFINIYKYILKQFSNLVDSHKNPRLKSFSFISNKECQQFISQRINIVKEYEGKDTLIELFEEQIKKYGDKVAIVYEGKQISYGELNRIANCLGNYLREKYGIDRELRVGLCLERSEYILIGILAVLKAGGCYVPMVSSYPEERIKYVIKDADCKVVLCSQEYESRIKKLVGSNRHIISIDSKELLGRIQNYKKDNLQIITNKNDLAYIIYTSGTTGKPKGVMQFHWNVVRLFATTNEIYKFNNNDVWSLYHSYIFDFTIWEIWGSLLYGGKLVILTQENILNPRIFYELSRKQKITVLNQTPVVFYQFINESIDKGKLEDLRYIIFGGEALNTSKLRGWLDYYGYTKPRLINMYGITESTVHVTYKEIVEKELNNKSIGKCLLDLNIYILSKELELLPIGAVGEIYIGREGLARGYLNRAGLTAERFVANPYAREEDIKRGYSRLYKTGDIGRYLTDGNIEYIGRNDEQVKIRGYRIELGEIENVLQGYKGIKQSVVLAKEREEGDKYLVGYYVSEEEIDEEDIESYLGKKLPEYMLPSKLKKIEEIPLTVNGKIDKKALPEVEFRNEENYVEARNELERKICEIWEEVLGIDKVGIKDDFFRLGGDSILAIRLISLINQKLKLTIKIRDLFISKCIYNFQNIVQVDVGNNEDYQKFSLFNKRDIKELINDSNIIDDIYPASSLQTGMLIESDISNAGTYHDVFSYKLNLKFDRRKFFKIWNQLILKHELLRAAFVLSKDYLTTVIYKNIEIKFFMHENKCIKELIESERKIDFNIDNPGLFRLIINNIGEQFNLIFSFHHAIADGWSVASLINEFVQAYAFDTGIKNDYTLEYGEFVQNELVTIKNKEFTKFWLRYLDSMNFTKFYNKLSKTDSIHYSQFSFDKEISDLINNISKQLGITPDNIFLFTYLKILSYFTNNTDITIGLVVNNRLEKEGGDRLFGLFLNTIPFRFKIQNGGKTNQFVKVFNEKLKLQQYKNLPYSYIKSLFNEEIYHFAFNYVHFHILDESRRIIQEFDGYERTDIPFMLNIAKLANDKYVCNINIINSYVSNDFLEYFTSFYKESFKHLLVDSNNALRLSKDEYKKQVIKWNETEKDYGGKETLIELFEEQADKTPDRIAVIYEDKQISYRELNNKANCLGNYLRKEGNLRREERVILCLNRSEYMLIGILGVLKAGGCYVPISPSYPEERIEYVIEDADCQVILCNEEYVEKLKKMARNNIQIISVDGKGLLEKMADYKGGNLEVRTSQEDLVYIIYTSGTTGKPKGVTVKQAGVVNRIKWMNEKYPLDRNDKIMQKTPYTFDVSVWELLWANWYGGSIVFAAPEGHRDIAYIKKLSQKEQITIMHFVPTMLSVYIDGLDSNYNHNLRRIFSSGEELKISAVKDCYKNLEGIEIHNLYGPTEASIDVLYYNCVDMEISDVHIGKPIANTQAYILSGEFKPLPIGAAGEIYVGGIGLARGYLNRAGLTAEKFVANPFATEEDIKRGYSRLYKTGDIGRYLADGNIEYIGRNDEQVKIRGYRIELGEIENVLQEYKGIKQSVVLAKEREEGDKYLIGYYVSEVELDEEDLESYLGNKLPEYMLPSKLKRIEEIPLTSNGKIDKKGLPEVEFINEENYVAPRNDIEKKICEIWKEVLRIDKVGIKDDFFRLGGHSLLAISIISKIKENINIEVKFRDIFQFPILEDLCKKLSYGYPDKSLLPPITRGKTNEDMILSFSQHRLWFIEQLTGDSSLYHIPIYLSLNGNLDIDILQKSLDFLVNRHEVLRTTIVIKQDVVYQSILPKNTPFCLKVIKENNKEVIDKKIIEEVEKPFSFSTESLCRGLIVKKDKRKYILLLTFHHMIIDHWSFDIFKDELFKCYSSFINGSKPKLFALNVRYCDFSIWQRNFLTGDIFEKQLKYWQKSLRNVQNLNLPIDKPRSKEQSFVGGSYSYKLGKETLDKVRKISIDENVTIFIFLITVFKAFLSKKLNQEDIVIGTPIANRNSPELSGVIGMFLNTLAIRCNIDGNPKFKNLLQRVKEVILQSYDNQDIPFEHVVDNLNINRDLSRHPVFQVMFVFQKENAKLVDLPDLTISNYEIIDRNKAKFEITLSIVETSEGLIIEVNYAKSLYNKNTIVNIAKGYGKFLEEVLSDKNKRLSDICIFSQEKEKNVKEWNNVPHNYNSKNLLHTLFEEQVFKNPDKVAIDYHNNQLTFKEINVRANQLTQYLLSIKNTSNKLIGVCLWKTHEVLIPLIAILKSGSGYVPIDPEYPQDRIQSILQNSAVQIIITSKEFVKRFDGFLGKIICTEDKEKFSQYSEYNVNNVSRSANSIAYVIYTSGSTGKPKGVTINHNSVVNTINSINYKFSLTSIDKVLGLSSLGFDLSVYDFFGITAVGGTIVLPDRERSKDPAYWLDLILKHSITIWNSVPQLAQLIIDSYDFSKFSINSKNIIFLLSGDRIPLQLPAQIKQKFLNSNVISLGGATEGSIWSIWYDTQDLSNYNVNIPYGKSMPNQNMYILDRFGDHCDIGVIGDIYIGGKGLALGYYNMPMQTAEMFMANPFCIDKYDQYNNQGLGSRIYKTGDIGKYLPDGNIEYVGRSDFQVKVRGYRIELGEIENIITNVFGVRQSVVVVFENELKNKKLITYIVLDKERNNILESNIIQSIKNHCENFLPEYMRPNEIIVLDEMPLSGNGKIARDKLPKPEIQEKVAKYHSPLGRCEEALAEIWVLLLGLEKVGRNDNFFNLGGDSIISIQMVSRAKKAGIFFDIKQVFHTPTIIGLARNSKTKHIQQSSQKYTAEGKVKLLPIQEWFFKNFKNYNHFNQAFWFKSEGKIEIEKIKDIIQQIRVYHEAFRLRYKLESERWIGCYEVKVSDMFFETVDEHLTDYELSSIITNKQKSLDIKNGPIDSLIWVEGRGLLWIIHHLIIDGVSWRILLQDINDLWAGKELEEKSDNYKSWSEYLYQFNDFKTITKYYNHLSYHNLTYDSNLNDDTIKQQDVLFSKEITKSFLVEAHKAYNTQANDLLLLALLLSIGDVQGQYQITIMLEGHGRDGLNSNLDLTRSIGWFTTMFPVELKTTHANNLSASIKEVKEILRQIPDQGLGYGIANMKGQIKSGKVDVLFNYLGQLDSIDDESTKFKFGNSLVGETIGDKDLKYALEINGQIISKQLGFIWNYTNNPSLKTIKNIIAQFEKRFIQIIKHCTDQQDINYTPSDFSALDLDQAELDEILDNL